MEASRPRIPSPRGASAQPHKAAARTSDEQSLWIGEAEQWISTTPCRLARDPLSWLQAVHWVLDTSAYTPRRTHGPQFCETTLRIAEHLAELSPCRPGVDFLMRLTGLSERTVQYHLEMLRESGLLVYRSKGTRVRGARLASEFSHSIPPEFDADLGIRTIGSGPDRRATGIAESGRSWIAKLAKKAARKARRRRAKAPKRTSSAGLRCTPMGGGTSMSSAAGLTGFPSESKLGTGTDASTTPSEQVKPRHRALNTVGRRYRLAREVVQQLPWLGRAPVPRVAWLLRHVSDAGWTASEIIAVVEQDAVSRFVHRPTGFLAHRLKGAHLLYDSPRKRTAIVDWWRDSRQAEHARHDEWSTVWAAPRRSAVVHLVSNALRSLHRPAPAGDALPDLDGIDDLADEEITQLRTAAWREYLAGESTLIGTAVDTMGQPEAERLYGTELVRRTLRLVTHFGRRRAVIGR
ncbi:helix-turn-helix domain-containing protein [Kitasatospora sp. NBC_00240]|uniref:helix-turn-helix domain-containing protein n=1 Tax=Kitasatospora sp. NBC_00240 TaxID=2903567 RepID=UPI00225ACA28|nr:helix-turn-helix domain-containing protein [Kitasatospora sp. NBC_00240]MCX5216187.1 helix-turn-helix domain-containing protein [Kitasatospora sp. NBC_00240]